MRIIRELNAEEREVLRLRLHADPKLCQVDLDMIKRSLTSKHCCWAELTRGDFAQLIINSSPRNPNPRLEDHPLITTAIEEIRQWPTLLDTPSRPDYRGLNGPQVKLYYELFIQGSWDRLGECFVTDKLQGMRDDGKYYVTDGMHRLVAFGLATRFDDQLIPLKIYYCTDSVIGNQEP